MPQDLAQQIRHRLFDAIDPQRRWLGGCALALAVGIAYFLSARLSLALLTKPDGVAVFWPAAGVAAGVLIALGPSARRPVAAGAMVATIVANLLGDRTLLSSLAFALCNAGEAVLTAGLIQHYFGSSFSLGRLRHVLGLLAAAVVGAAVSGIGGSIGYIFFQGSTAPAVTTWEHWFASDALGIVTVAPVLIGLAAAARDRPPRGELIEGGVALVATTAMGGLVIFLPPPPAVGERRVDRAALSGAAVARGPLPAGVRRGGRLHHLAHHRVDDDLRHRPVRRHQFSDCRPHPGRPGGHPRRVALRIRPCGAVRRAAAARGGPDGE